MLRLLRSRRGQIVVPAMFLLPTLFIFVYLIYETAKLSRVKIRHQFAVDAAIFVEMTNYSDFLNRSAYVNGAFPMRIFAEGFSGTTLDCMGKTNCAKPEQLHNILYIDGVYPRSTREPDPEKFKVDSISNGPDQWDIKYYDGQSDGGIRGRGMNSDNPTPGVTCKANNNSYDNCVVIVSMETAKFYNVNWEDSNQIYKLYVQIYQLLGSVESAQYSVLQRLQAQHNFLTKSYWLNVGNDNASAESGTLRASFASGSGGNDQWTKGNQVKFHCVKHVLFHGNQLVHSWGQPYQIWASDPPPTMPSTGVPCEGDGQLFQVVTVRKSVIESLRRPGSSGYPGWPVEVRYAIDGKDISKYDNYFGENLQQVMNQEDGGGPKVHATAAIGGFGVMPAVWAETGAAAPTPKFQVRSYP